MLKRYGLVEELVAGPRLGAVWAVFKKVMLEHQAKGAATVSTPAVTGTETAPER